jgi:hypothetical protein
MKMDTMDTDLAMMKLLGTRDTAPGIFQQYLTYDEWISYIILALIYCSGLTGVRCKVVRCRV